MTEPTHPLDWLLRLLAALVLALFSVSEKTVSPPDGPPPAQGRIPHVIESVEIRMLESFPVQISLHVVGYQPDGCDYPVQVTQRRETNTVYVEIYRELPADLACPAVLKFYEAEIPLDGGFEKGDYTFNVNGFVVRYSP